MKELQPRSCGPSDNLKLMRFYLRIAIVREIYNGENSQEQFEMELEKALEDSYEIIIIEPSQLGKDTQLWISMGNCLHKTSVLSGLGSIISAYVWPGKTCTFMPLAILSLVCAGLYTLSWQTDPCVAYQVEQNAGKVERLSAGSCVVLVRKKTTPRIILHSTISMLAACTCAWRFFYLFRKRP
ncbi:unnamed protein product [Darwinula stevensoni]|uniref:Transmembrane protein 11 n=1 Tax=Darwinula stevensoni TaxID=69355 RepID=A0A7R9ADU6_9CRUS|nr:unnamed protein product [Darwinula stevensoni]CAG0901321.1 unnamed protein product [Darwinula stevensoni]